MDRIYRLVEQMDLALDQLAEATPSASRFALILVDNAVELALHMACDTALRFNDTLGYTRPYDAKQRAAALGQYFGPKVEFCVTLGMLSPSEAAFVRDVHEYRNELYHTGLLYDQIILPLAWQYFGLAADLIAKVPLGGWRMTDPDSPRVKKYFPGSIRDRLPAEGIAKAARKVVAARAPLPQSFTTMLSDFAQTMVQQVQDDLDFIGTDNFRGFDAQRALFEVQLWHYAFDAPNGPQLSQATVPDGGSPLQRLEELRSTFRPKFSRSPTPRWMKRAQDITRAETPYAALAVFQRLKRDMRDLANILRESAQELDCQIPPVSG